MSVDQHPSQHPDQRRRQFDPGALGAGETALLVKSILIPRPIAWVGTVSSDSVANLAPHSFFTMASQDPPVVLFSSTGRKDSLRNIEQTGQFTISLVPARLRAPANQSSASYPSEVDEFAATGLATEASVRVEAPRVAASPAVLECRLERIDPVGDSFVVYGRIVHVCVDEDTLTVDARGRTLPEAHALDPMARLGRSEWATLGEVLAIDRPGTADEH